MNHPSSSNLSIFRIISFPSMTTLVLRLQVSSLGADVGATCRLRRGVGAKLVLCARPQPKRLV